MLLNLVTVILLLYLLSNRYFSMPFVLFCTFFVPSWNTVEGLAKTSVTCSVADNFCESGTLG